LSIDPGSHSTGLALLELDSAGNIGILHAETIDPNTQMRYRKYIIRNHTERFCRFVIICDEVLKLLRDYNPRYVSIESSYMSRFPQAYAVLTEEIALIRMTVFNYDPSIVFLTEEPSAIKKAMGVNGKLHDKELIKQAVLAYGATFNSHVNLEVLDEHAFDAIAGGISQCMKLNSP
jgi:Holliday junction resolvasome RuvABC endonuclease subunit